MMIGKTVQYVFAFVFVGMQSFGAMAATEVSGTQSGVWRLENSPFIVRGNLIIPAGQKLIIEPGTVVKFAGPYALRVEGCLVARGESRKRIIFTSLNDNEFGRLSEVRMILPTSQDWRGIFFTNTAAEEISALEYCIIRYVRTPVRCQKATPILRQLIIADAADVSLQLNENFVKVQDGLQVDYALPAHEPVATESSARQIFTALEVAAATPELAEVEPGAAKTQTNYDTTSAQTEPQDKNKQPSLIAAQELTFGELSVDLAVGMNSPINPAPGSVSIISQRQIEESGAIHFFDLLRIVPGLNLRMTPMGWSFGIHSFGDSPFSERVLLLLDGMPINSSTTGGFPSLPSYYFISPDHIKHIEVTRGPGSVNYGANAYFGVVNVVTKKGADFKGGKIAAVTGANTTNNYRWADGASNGSYQWSASGLLNFENGPLHFNTDTRMQVGHLLANADLTQTGTHLQFYHQQDNTSPVVFDSAAPTLGTHQRLNTALLTQDLAFGKTVSMSTRLLYMNRRGNTCASCHNPTSLTLPYKAQSETELSERFAARSEFQFAFSPTHQLLLGGEYVFDRNSRRIVRVAEVDKNSSVASAYLQDQFMLFNRLMTLAGGVRVDAIATGEKLWSPRVAFVVAPSSRFIVKGDVAKAYRPPSWNERFLTSVHATSQSTPQITTLFGRPAINAETIVAATLGFETYLSNTTTLKCFAFSNRLNDFIVLDNDFINQTSRYLNHGGEVMLQGTDVQLSLAPTPRLVSTIFYSYQKASVNDTRDGVANETIHPSYAPQHKVGLDVTFSPHRRLRTNLLLSSWSSFLSSRRSYGAAPVENFATHRSYSLLDGRLTYRLPLRENSLAISVLGKNLLDEKVSTTPVGPLLRSELLGRQLFFDMSFFY